MSKQPDMSKTKLFEDKDWQFKYMIKNTMSFKLKHEFEMLGPLPKDPDDVKIEKVFKQKCFLLGKLLIDPVFNPDAEDNNGVELDELYDRILIHFHLDIDLTSDEQKMILGVPEDKRGAIFQDIAIQRRVDLKKKLRDL